MNEYKLVAISITDVQEIPIDIKNRMESEGRVLNPPRYTTQLPNGAKQEFEHDAQSIQDTNTSESERVLWEKYQKDSLQYDQEVQKQTMRYTLYRGVECEIPEGWQAERAAFGLSIPDNPIDLKVKYILSEIAKTPDDIQKLFLSIMRISAKGVDEQKIKAAEATFRNQKGS